MGAGNLTGETVADFQEENVMTGQEENLGEEATDVEKAVAAEVPDIEERKVRLEVAGKKSFQNLRENLGETNQVIKFGL